VDAQLTALEGRLAELVPVYVHETWGPWLQLLAIAFASALSAWVVWWILKFGATKVVGKTKTEVDDRLLEAAHWPLWVSVFLIGLRMGVARLPLADLTGLSRQTAVLAYQFGDGFTNMVVPTNPLLMGMLALARIPYQRWLQFVGPLLVKLYLVAIVALMLAVRMGY